MDIYEYEEKYVKKQNLKGAKSLVRILITALAILVATCLVMMVLRLWELHYVVGIVGAVVGLLVYGFGFIMPVVKLCRTESFQVNVNHHNARLAQKHNAKLRVSIAEKMIDVVNEVETIGWYDEEEIGRLAIACKCGDQKKLKQSLTALYQGSVKDTAKNIIFQNALKSGTYSALSQSSKIDTALVAVVNLQMIKDIVFLYGFRPSEARLVKIFSSVLQSSLISYGLGGANIGNGVVRTVGGITKSIPLLGSAIATIVDSSVQGLANGTMTAIIGYQTIKYLNTEYRLQDILDGVTVAETEEELQATCQQVKDGLAKAKVA